MGPILLGYADILSPLKTCGEGACPRWAAQQTQNRAASRPSGSKPPRPRVNPIPGATRGSVAGSTNGPVLPQNHVAGTVETQAATCRGTDPRPARYPPRGQT